MKYFYLLTTLLRNKGCLHRSFSGMLRTTSSILKSLENKVFLTSSSNLTSNFIHTDSEDNELYEDYHILENKMEHIKTNRNIILKNCEDAIITELNSCVSIEEILNLVTKYINIYEDKHAVQTVLVLRDLQKIFYQYNGHSRTATNMFLDNIKGNEGFKVLMEYIERKLDDFDIDFLSYAFFYLNKLGIPVENQLMQNMSLKIREHLLKHFDWGICSRFLTVIFSENSVRPYYLSLPIIPLVTSYMDQCNSVDDLYSVTICLNKLHNIVTTELLKKYQVKVTDFLKNHKLIGTDYPTLLKIILFLNYPEWRDKSTLLISECILLLKDDMHLLKLEDLAILYEVFFKNQEPGTVLNSIQRCSAKFLTQQDDSEATERVRLKLFSSLIYFSSPTHRIQFQRDAGKYLRNCHDHRALVELRKIFSYVKVSDPELCEHYWDLSLKILNEDEDANVLMLCQNYIHFNTNVNNYRHYKYEVKIMDDIKKSLSTDILLNPIKISCYLSFVMLYGKDRRLLELLLNKFEEHLSRINASDCLKISHSLSRLNNRRGSCMSKEQIVKTGMLLNKCTKNLLEVDENNCLQYTNLLKAFILRKDYDNELLECLLLKFKELDYMSSKIIESLSYVFLATGSLIPEIINKCTEYVINYKNNILGFNAEKLLYFCFYLAYCPINGNKFFETVTDVILRDQERLSGLAFLQCALSLCYFNKLPSSFIKQIFNVEFMEKLDAELENCYSKDKYPQRVRNILMMLNRAVCLEYPEYNVPWFHQKYIEEIQNRTVKDINNMFHQGIKEHLVQVLGTHQHISKNIITPYGYQIDFVINLNSKNEAVSPDSPEIHRRVALLLLRQHAFTQFYTHLKGKYQLKIRHLEMFGYEVVVINYNEWINLLYSGERIEYLSKLLQLPNRKCTLDVNRR